MLDAVVRAEPGMIEAIGSVPVAHPLVADGRAPVFLAIELGAQAAAALEALDRPAAGGQPRVTTGTIVRIREAHFARDTVPAGSPLHVTARLQGAAPPLAIYRISAMQDDAIVVEAVISTYSGPKGPTGSKGPTPGGRT